MRRLGMRCAFSLIELLIAVAIMAVVVGVIGASLSGGGRAWDAARNFNRSERDAVAGLERMQKDLMNAFNFSGLPFKGGPDAITLPGVVRMAGGQDATIGSITYTVDDRNRELIRRVKFYADETESEEPLVRELQNLEFAYYSLAADESGVRRWQDAGVQTTVLPARVDIRLAIGSSAQAVEFFRIVLLPGARKP